VNSSIATKLQNAVVVCSALSSSAGFPKTLPRRLQRRREDTRFTVRLQHHNFASQGIPESSVSPPEASPVAVGVPAGRHSRHMSPCASRAREQLAPNIGLRSGSTTSAISDAERATGLSLHSPLIASMQLSAFPLPSLLSLAAAPLAGIALHV